MKRTAGCQHKFPQPAVVVRRDPTFPGDPDCNTRWRISPRRVIVYTKLPAAPVVGPADWTDPNAVQSALLPVGTTQSAGPA